LRAQQPGKEYRLALFSAGSKPVPSPNRSAFFDALRDLGWIEGKNIIVEERYGHDQLDRLPELAAELVRLNVDVIVTIGALAPLAVWELTNGPRRV
jgi:putative ABC transport system substrate-binding protein